MSRPASRSTPSSFSCCRSSSSSASWHCTSLPSSPGDSRARGRPRDEPGEPTTDGTDGSKHGRRTSNIECRAPMSNVERRMSSVTGVTGQGRESRKRGSGQPLENIPAADGAGGLLWRMPSRVAVRCRWSCWAWQFGIGRCLYADNTGFLRFFSFFSFLLSILSSFFCLLVSSHKKNLQCSIGQAGFGEKQFQVHFWGNKEHRENVAMGNRNMEIREL